MKYPNGINKKINNSFSHSNRGMNLEADLNDTNQYYIKNNIAIVYKKPTPITINKVNYKSRSDAVITEAHFKIPSTTDYNGIYNGKYIDFEAKETKSMTSFPLNNIHKHQIEHLNRIVKMGGIGFIIVRFSKLNKTFLLFEQDLSYFLSNNDRSSIPIKYFNERGYLIDEKLMPRLDYLKVLKEKGV